MENVYIPFASEILEVIRHTEKEYTFRMEFRGIVKPGQFFEVSIPKFGEAPISVSGIGENFVDLTIRRVGRVTNEVFEHYQGQKLLMRGPYGNGFDVGSFLNGETVVVAGGTGVSPVRGVIEALSTSEQAISTSYPFSTRWITCGSRNCFIMESVQVIRILFAICLFPLIHVLPQGKHGSEG